MIRSIKQKLQNNGFDLCHPINTAWYNKMIQDEGLIDSGTLKVLPEPSPSITAGDENKHCDDGGGGGKRGVQSSYNAILIGNTKTIWSSFLDWLEVRVEEKENLQMNDHDKKQAKKDVIASNPFDTFCEETLSKSLEELCCAEDASGKISSYELFWSNGKRERFSMNEAQHGDSQGDTTKSANAKQSYHCFDNNNNDSFLVSMQRIASASGEYWHDEENTKLCVHPVYGTWTAFRALVVFETEQTIISSNIPSTLPSPCPCPLSQEEMKEAKRVFDYALEMNTCSGQGNNAGSYGTQANKTWDELCKYLHNQVCQGSSWDKVPESMKPWIELRNVIRVGRNDWKYDEPQLLYHYTKDPEILSIELGKRS